MEKDIDIEYSMPNMMKLQINKGFIDCYEIIDDIFYNGFG